MTEKVLNLIVIHDRSLFNTTVAITVKFEWDEHPAYRTFIYLQNAPIIPTTRAPYFIYHGALSLGSSFGRAINEVNFSAMPA